MGFAQSRKAAKQNLFLAALRLGARASGRELLPPLRRFVGFAGRLVQPHQTLDGVGQVFLPESRDTRFPLFHALVALQQQWLRLDVLVLAGQTLTEQALA